MFTPASERAGSFHILNSAVNGQAGGDKIASAILEITQHFTSQGVRVFERNNYGLYSA